MLSRTIFKNFRLISKNVCGNSQGAVNMFCNSNKPDKSKSILGDIGSKYQVFKDEDSEVILDVVEERQKYASRLEAEELEIHDPFDGLNLQRGTNGVFEIEDLIDVLKRENAENVFVVKVPGEINYVDYLCVVSGKSQRHMSALAQFVRRVYKQKRKSTDQIPKIEGVHSQDWLALDLGNIALHILSKEARSMYDIEALWAVGREYDKEFTKLDPVVEMLEKHSIYLKDLQPAS